MSISSHTVSCPACDSASPRKLFTEVPFDVKSDRATGFGKVYQCEVCGLGQVMPLPAPDEIDAHYDLPEYYTQGASHLPNVSPNLADRILTKITYLADRGAQMQRYLADHAAQEITDGKQISALDIGCGSGGLLKSLRQAGCSVTGIEPDPLARQNAILEGLEVFEGTAENLPSSLTGPYDLITMTHVLEHTLDPIEALENARTMLADEGLFYCEVPNAGCLHFERFHQISEMLDLPRHLFFFTQMALGQLARKAGFEIVSWHYTGYTRHHSPSWRAWECSIRERLKARGASLITPQHTYWQSLMLASMTLFAPESRKYDCIGFMACPTKTEL